jgi:hypothetical protein
VRPGGFLLYNFPATVAQAQALEKELNGLEIKKNKKSGLCPPPPPFLLFFSRLLPSLSSSPLLLFLLAVTSYSLHCRHRPILTPSSFAGINSLQSQTPQGLKRTQ